MFGTRLQIQSRALEAGGNLKEGLTDKIAGYLVDLLAQIPAWIAGAIVFLMSIAVAKIAKAAVEARISRQIDEEHQEVLILSGRVTYFLTLALGVTVALKIAGIDLTAILAAVAFGIGFALRDLIMNFIAGVMILMSRQFAIGDIIRVNDKVGRVVEIQSRATILRAFDGTKVIVPNSEIFTNVVTSLTTNPTRRIEVPLDVAYGTNLKYAIKVILDSVKKHQQILKKPQPNVIIKCWDSSNISLTLWFWVNSRDRWLKIRNDVMQAITKAYESRGIQLSFEVRHIETMQDIKEEIERSEELASRGIAEMENEERGFGEQAKNAIDGQVSKPMPESPAAPQGLIPQTVNIAPAELAAVPVPVAAAPESPATLAPTQNGHTGV